MEEKGLVQCVCFLNYINIQPVCPFSSHLSPRSNPPVNWSLFWAALGYLQLFPASCSTGPQGSRYSGEATAASRALPAGSQCRGGRGAAVRAPAAALRGLCRRSLPRRGCGAGGAAGGRARGLREGLQHALGSRACGPGPSLPGAGSSPRAPGAGVPRAAVSGSSGDARSGSGVPGRSRGATVATDGRFCGGPAALRAGPRGARQPRQEGSEQRQPRGCACVRGRARGVGGGETSSRRQRGRQVAAWSRAGRARGRPAPGPAVLSGRSPAACSGPRRGRRGRPSSHLAAVGLGRSPERTPGGSLQPALPRPWARPGARGLPRPWPRVRAGSRSAGGRAGSCQRSAGKHELLGSPGTERSAGGRRPGGRAPLSVA